MFFKLDSFRLHIVFKIRNKDQCSGSVNISYGSGSADPIFGIADPDTGGKLIMDPRDPDPEHCIP